ncbi:o-succinylbenzoate synthase [Aquibacillus koreensis]|uniref:o-succinylbenzoate synthase n=1 Tax=Aquibacillus koreensis TaxID=279446 RepID=A0A9X4AJU6_9BACI|nr:o-succinylbenzoate synthase [Aquibacillus koreensis]MCT2538267.1 o-succinylbenzoate synthase [Aquibacillus koreensis]MDC3420790.1 o-succinylbenzoate synthase [Aquibacillus koreensis]
MTAINVKQVILHRMLMLLKQPFETNLGTFQQKDFFIVEVIDKEGNSGYGETVAFPSPWYTEETVETNWHVMEDFLIPLLMESPIEHPDEVSGRFKVIRRNNMAKAALEGAVWDLYAKREGISLSEAIGGTKKAVDVGVAIGIQSSTTELLELIEQYTQQGYKRVKLKIKPGHDLEVLREVRKQFPTLPIMADANSAYTLADLEHLKKLDELDLMMIEQPLQHDDFIDHATLQKELNTPICLDESIHTYSDAKTAIALGSCKIISIKPGRVGGITEAKKIHDLCAKHDIPVWCGGMLEAGVGRAHSLAIATLPQFTLPGDTAASANYWASDIITPEVTVDNGQVILPEEPGIGYQINWTLLEAFRIDKMVVN